MEAVLIQPELQADAALMQALARLLPQLKQTDLPARDEIQAILVAPGTTLLSARLPDAPGHIVGLLTLVTYRVPTGLRARIEDVVVDADFRGRGIGAALTREALRRAQLLGADGVALTSNPRRVAANRLYQKIGFRRWETNLYFYPLKSR